MGFFLLKNSKKVSSTADLFDNYSIIRSQVAAQD